MKQEPTTAQALAALIGEKAARLDRMKQAGRELETRCNDKKALRHLATAYEIALYCLVLRPHERDLLRLQQSPSQETGGFFSIRGRLARYAGVCDNYHRRVLHDKGVNRHRNTWAFREPETPPSIPQRIEVPADCFTPVTPR